MLGTSLFRRRVWTLEMGREDHGLHSVFGPYAVMASGELQLEKEEQPVWKRGLVRLAGIEPTTLGFGGQYSIH